MTASLPAQVAAQVNVENTLSCLQHSIEDSQGTIRAFDAKAEVLGVLLTLALGITNFALLEKAEVLTKLFIGSAWVFGVASMVYLGAVLHPKRNIFQSIDMGGYMPQGTYFWLPDTPNSRLSIKDRAEKALGTDWVVELTYENVKLALIRDWKYKCFKKALYWAGGALLCVAVSIVSDVVTR